MRGVAEKLSVIKLDYITVIFNAGRIGGRSVPTVVRSFPRPNGGAFPKLAFNARLLGGLFMGSLAATATLPSQDSDSPRPWWRNPFMRIPPPEPSLSRDSTQGENGGTSRLGKAASIALIPGVSKHDPLLLWSTVSESHTHVDTKGFRGNQASVNKEEEAAALLAYTELMSNEPPLRPVSTPVPQLPKTNASSSGWLSRDKPTRGSNSSQAQPQAIKEPLMSDSDALLAYATADENSKYTTK